MPQTQLSQRYGSNNSIFDLKETPRIQKSKFDFSRKNQITLDMGAIVPVDLFQVFPGDNVKLGIRYLLDTLPLVVPPMNNYRVRTHWYYCKMSSLWKGWESFVTKGRSGTIDLEVPSLDTSGSLTFTSDFGATNRASLSCPHSLFGYFHLPVRYMSDNSPDSTPQYLPFISDVGANGHFIELRTSYPRKVSALPFMMYQKIYRDNYAPVNLLTDCKVWYPDDLNDEWRIDYNASNINSRGSFVPNGTVHTPIRANFVPFASSDVDECDTCVDLRMLRYACYENDYFTSSKPWIVRGVETQLDSSLSVDDIIESISLDHSGGIVSKSVTNSNGSPGSNESDIEGSSLDVSTGGSVGLFRDGSISVGSVVSYTGNTVSTLLTRTGDVYSLSKKKELAKMAINANTLRNMLALSVWQERNAIVNGNYNAFTRAHFNISPRSPEYEPVYLGGTSDIVQFGQVLQTSAGTSDSPLATQAGIGSTSGQGDVFNFSVNDYGLIMGVMIISPEVIYTQGLEHVFTDLKNSDIFQPEFANLGYQEIRNKELYFTGDDTTDEDVFGYQARYSYLKQRRNVAGGLFAVPPSNDRLFSAYVQSRHFDSLPKLSAQFVSMTPDNLRRDFLAFPNQPAFRLQFASDVELIRALPYQSEPNTFGF